VKEVRRLSTERLQSAQKRDAYTLTSGKFQFLESKNRHGKQFFQDGQIFKNFHKECLVINQDKWMSGPYTIHCSKKNPWFKAIDEQVF
jgi:hypothetical protein